MCSHQQTAAFFSHTCDVTSLAFWLNLIDMPVRALIKYSCWCQNSVFLMHWPSLLLSEIKMCSWYSAWLWCLAPKSLCRGWNYCKDLAFQQKESGRVSFRGGCWAAWEGQAASGQYLQQLQILLQVGFFTKSAIVLLVCKTALTALSLFQEVSLQWSQFEDAVYSFLCFLNHALCMCPHARIHESKNTWKCISVHCSHCSICLYHLCLASLLHYHFYPWGSCNLYLLIIFLHPNMFKEERLKNQRKVLKCRWMKISTLRVQNLKRKQTEISCLGCYLPLFVFIIWCWGIWWHTLKSENT